MTLVIKELRKVNEPEKVSSEITVFNPEKVSAEITVFHLINNPKLCLKMVIYRAFSARTALWDNIQLLTNN